MSDTTPHTGEIPAAGPAVGQDEWVARHAERTLLGRGPLAPLEARLRRVPWWAWLVLFVAAFSLLPVFESSGYVRRVGFDTVIYMLLALGLNVVVGWGGLLDLGFVAFYGIGAYTYAILDSGKFGIHLPTLVSVPVVVAVGAIAGFLLGLPSRRLSGDYLAIVTLFFLQLFQTITTNGDSIFGHDVTGGPNGILDVDPFNLFGHDLAVQHGGVFAISYLYVALGLFAIVFVALRLLNDSRTGRAWRSLREDPLAAEAMGMPVSWLKLMSFSCGAAVAALTGTVFAALSASVFPLTFYFVLLITVYTMVILGGSGSQSGVVLGAVDHRAAARDAPRRLEVARDLLRRARGGAGGGRAPLTRAGARRGLDGRVRLRRARCRRRGRRQLGGRRAPGRLRRLRRPLGGRARAPRPVDPDPSPTSA